MPAAVIAARLTSIVIPNGLKAVRNLLDWGRPGPPAHKDGLRRQAATREGRARRPKIGRAATLVMFQPPTPARELGSVETCTIAAPDAITAFAVPNPGGLSQGCRFFRVWRSLRVAPPNRSPSLLWTGYCLGSQAFQPSTGLTLSARS